MARQEACSQRMRSADALRCDHHDGGSARTSRAIMRQMATLSG